MVTNLLLSIKLRKCDRIFLFVSLFTIVAAFTSSAQCDSAAYSFVGTWKVSRLIEVEEGEPGPEGTETSYPDTLIIICNNGKIKANYIDQFGRHGSFSTLLDNKGNDLILAFSDLTSKDPKSFSIIHHTKILGDSLQGVALGRVRLFEWRSSRLSAKKNIPVKKNGKDKETLK
jgi:hypothetical protein